MAVGLVVSLLAVTAAACTAPPGPGVIACAWSYNADPTALPAFPDTSATYFRLNFLLGPDQSLELNGEYPHARYLALATYGLDGNVIDSVADVDIEPEPGSDNPFATPGASTDPAHRRYHLTVAPAGTPQPVAPNTLSAGPGSYAAGFLLMRIYVPDDPADLAGSVERPSVAVRESDGSLTPIDQCAPTAGAPLQPSALAAALAGPQPNRSQPTFVREIGGSLFPNPDNAYLAATTSWSPGRVVVVRGMAPTFPDTRAGDSPSDPAQVRYWSMCTNTNVLPFPVVACSSDAATALDSTGRYTFVVSTPEDRPATATTERGVTWLPWGDATLPGVLILRNMLPSPDFPQSIRSLPPGAAADALGVYAPSAKYCTATSFETTGIDC